MRKFIFPGSSRLPVCFPVFCRRKILRPALLFALPGLIALNTAAQTPADTSASEDLAPLTQDTIVVGHGGRGGAADSGDVFLSTDTNTHDIAPWINSGYVLSSQELRHIPAAKIRDYKNEEAFAYANDPAYWQREEVRNFNHLNLVLWWRIFLCVCGAFLLYGIYRLSKENFSGLFLRKTRSRETGEATAAEEELLTVDELETRLSAAVGAGDYRTAVRLHYLKLIKMMETRNLVPADRLSTNRAWAGVFSDPEKARQFRSLSSAYEYVFYGGFVPDEGQFAALQERFVSFGQKLPA